MDEGIWVSIVLHKLITNFGLRGKLGQLEHHFMPDGKLANTQITYQLPNNTFLASTYDTRFDVLVDGNRLHVGTYIGRILRDRDRVVAYSILKAALAAVDLHEN